MVRRYERLRHLSVGRFGVSLLIKDVESDTLAMMKTIDVAALNGAERSELLRELRGLTKLRHPYLLPMRESFLHQGLSVSCLEDVDLLGLKLGKIGPIVQDVVCRYRMAATIYATLLSGRAVRLQISPESTVNDLRQLAQQSLGVGIDRLWTKEGGLDLLPDSSLKKAGLCTEQVVTLTVRQLRIVSPWECLGSLLSWPFFEDVLSPEAFAAIRPDGRVVTWGFGPAGDPGLAQERLEDVRDVQATAAAFAALRCDGSVVSWGEAAYGGDSSSVQDQLCNVLELRGSSSAFAALRADGRVVSWGSVAAGGDCSSVQDRLQDVVALRASFLAFAAIRKDGQVVTWGEDGDSSAVQDQLNQVREVRVSCRAFAAIKADGGVVAWGRGPGACCDEVQEQLTGVKDIRAVATAFAALRWDGLVVTWGLDLHRGVSNLCLTGVASLHCSFGAFAALRHDGSVATWGHPLYGGDSEAVGDQLVEVLELCASSRAFAALRRDQRVVAWGLPRFGGDCSSVQEQLTDVESLKASGCAFAALRRDGRVVTWGCGPAGGDSSEVQEQLTEVTQIWASSRAFAAVRMDGRLVTWGDALHGGDSSAVEGQLQCTPEPLPSAEELGDTRSVSEGPELAQPGPQLNGAAVRHRDFSQQSPEFQKREDEGDGNELSNSEPLAGRLCLVMDYLPRGSLSAEVDAARSFGTQIGPEKVLHSFVQALLGLSYLHSCGTLHRDLRTKRLLRTQSGLVVLTGTALSVVVRRALFFERPNLDALRYRSPELLMEPEAHTAASDMWAMGIILYELMALRTPWEDEHAVRLLEKIRNQSLRPPPKQYSEELAPMCHKMLKREPQSRATAEELLQTPFVQARIVSLLDAELDDAAAGGAVPAQALCWNSAEDSGPRSKALGWPRRKERPRIEVKT
ncbi:Serine/threonine-protein kinase Nek1 [Symbiodinium microadriaticum]|uniref:non-specific serine/threonine protein kinase n=1 Tax=Symbiodinium microadriaticum TaxID=2951 RepID=A0A1Q9E1Q8_SYMMI|nr:Serine/threonine-protein kinase Nek1 [Symbiodinium microadriaticum]